MTKASSGPPGGGQVNWLLGVERPVRVVILNTGTEVLYGRVEDRNGGFIAERMRAAGCEVLARSIIPDSRELLTAMLASLSMLGVELIVVTGGLGSTIDDCTAEAIEQLLGAGSALNADLLARIRSNRQYSWGLRPDVEEDWRQAAEIRQATVPVGVDWLGPASRASAPTLIVPPSADSALIVALPGVPREVREMLPLALQSVHAQQLIRRATPLLERTIRFWGIDEAAVDATLRSAEEAGLREGMDWNVCFVGEGRSEVWVVTSFAEPDAPVYGRLEAMVRAAHGTAVYSTDGRAIEQVLAPELAGRTIAVVDTSGSDISVRLHGRAGKLRCLSLDDSIETLETVVGLSPRELSGDPEWLAAAMADGALQRRGADIGVGLYSSRPGVVHVATRSRRTGHIQRTVGLDDELALRGLAATYALHEIRELLEREQLA